MGRNYKQITLAERCQITQLPAAGCKFREIAAALDRAPSTIARELKRNGSRTKGYEPSYAQQQARARRWSGCRLERDQGLREAVLSRLAQGWSPEQVAGRLAREADRRVISHESIYRFIYAQLACTKDYLWRHYLPRTKSKRGFLRMDLHPPSRPAFGRDALGPQWTYPTYRPTKLEGLQAVGATGVVSPLSRRQDGAGNLSRRTGATARSQVKVLSPTLKCAKTPKWN